MQMQRVSSVVLFAAVAAAVASGNAAGADVALKEPFDYAPGRLGGKAGWSELPRKSARGEVVAGSLSFGNVLTKGGKLLLPAGTSTQTAIPYSVDWDVDGSLVSGFMVRKVDFATTGAFFNFGLANRDTPATEQIGRGGIGSTEKFVMDWPKSAETAADAYALGSTVFIVMKITTASGNGADRIAIEFYDTPDAAGGIAGAKPAGTLAQSHSTHGTTSHLSFIMGENVAAGMIDEIRIGSNVRDVAPLGPRVAARERVLVRDNKSPKAIVFNDRGWSTWMRYPGPTPMTLEQIASTAVAPLVGTGVKVYQFCAQGGYGVNYSSALTPRAQVNQETIDDVHLWRTQRTLRYLDSLDTDPLSIISEACRKNGIACQFSLRTSGADSDHKPIPWFRQHPDALLESGALNYSHDDSIAWRKAQIQEVLDRYEVDGIDLDFTRFQPTFAQGEYRAAAANLNRLVRDLREMTRKAGKTLSARFDVSPNPAIAGGLDVESMLAEGVFDQISLGSLGDRTPNVSAGWWIQRTQATNCKVYPGIEGRWHVLPNQTGGGQGSRPALGAIPGGYGQLSPAFMRAVAGLHYADGADGVTLFNPTCADGPFDESLYNDLADPATMAFQDKRYTTAVWPFRAEIFGPYWTSRFKISPSESSASYKIRVADDFDAAARAGKTPRAVLTLDCKGINHIRDVDVLVNGTSVAWNGYEFNHWDHGYWDDILEFDVPTSALRRGDNTIELKRLHEHPGFAGNFEVRKCILDIVYPGSRRDPREQAVRRRLKSDRWFAPGKIVEQEGREKPRSPQRKVAPKELPKIVIYNDDGWSSYMRYPAPQTPEDIAEKILGPVLGTGVTVYQFCALGGHAVNYNSSFLPRVGEMMDQVDTMHVWRMRRTLRYLEEKHNTDPLHIMCKACRKHGIACQFSLRMNDAHHVYRRGNDWYFPELQSPWFEQHKDAMLPNYTLDYEHPDVHTYRKRQIREILDNYDVSGIDLDFTRFAPWFRGGREKAGMPKMTQLIRELRAMTKAKGKTLSARFEYDPHHCIRTGLDLETMLTEGLFDQITLGVTGSPVPDAPVDWWVERTRKTGCKLCPGIEGQFHWIPSSGSSGGGTLPAEDGVRDGQGPPSMAFARAVASVQYASGTDGVSLFNYTCSFGPFDLAAFTELGDPESMRFKDKQYVARVWYKPFRMGPGENSASYTLRLSDDFQDAKKRCTPGAVLTLSLKGIARIDDVEVCSNSTPLDFNGYHYNQSDHGSFSDVLKYDVPVSALRQGENAIELRRVKENSGFSGSIEVRKLVLDIKYPVAPAPGKSDR